MRNSVYRISLEMHDTASQALLNVKKFLIFRLTTLATSEVMKTLLISILWESRMLKKT